MPWIPVKTDTVDAIAAWALLHGASRFNTTLTKGFIWVDDTVLEGLQRKRLPNENWDSLIRRLLD